MTGEGTGFAVLAMFFFTRSFHLLTLLGWLENKNVKQNWWNKLPNVRDVKCLSMMAMVNPFNFCQPCSMVGGRGRQLCRRRGRNGGYGGVGWGWGGCSKSWDSCHQACIASCTCPKKYQILGNSLVVAFSEPCLKSWQILHKNADEAAINSNNLWSCERIL